MLQSDGTCYHLKHLSVLGAQVHLHHQHHCHHYHHHHCLQSCKHGVSRVYASPRPHSPAGGNTRDDFTAARDHWPRDAAHLSNRLPVKWRQPVLVPFTLTVVGRAERVPTSEAALWLAEGAESERLLLREKGRAVCVGCATQTSEQLLN